jgi:hypothetical protein
MNLLYFYVSNSNADRIHTFFRISFYAILICCILLVIEQIVVKLFKKRKKKYIVDQDELYL